MNKTITFLFAVCACTSLNAMDIKNLKVKAFGAARTGDKAALKAALNQSFDINSCTDSSPSLTLLGYAAFYDQGRIIKFLFKRGAKIYIPGTVNPLEHPILCKKIYTIDTLLQLGANVKPDKNFETNSGIIHTGIKLAQNFITAAKNQQFDVMEYLLQNGNADMFLNVTDDSGNTALHYATLHNRQDIATFLLQYVTARIDLTLKNQQEKTAIDLAKEPIKGILLNKLYELTQK